MTDLSVQSYACLWNSTMRSVAIVGLCIMSSIGYGVVQDQFTARFWALRDSSLSFVRSFSGRMSTRSGEFAGQNTTIEGS
jgi:hypothetical protein